jgi:hypothetical protein
MTAWAIPAAEIGQRGPGLAAEAHAIGPAPVITT